MAVMIVPMTAIMVQLVANYARDPCPVGAVDLVTARLDPTSRREAGDVTLELPDGIVLDAPAGAHRRTARSCGACGRPPPATTCCASTPATR
jgi:hypothetical protein